MKLPAILRFTQPSPLAKATHELETAQRDLLDYQAHAEYYAAMEEMLEARVRRLRRSVADLSQESFDAPLLSAGGTE